jgi:hypothetical protein
VSCEEEDKNPTLVEDENEFVHSQGGALKVSKASVVATTIPLFSFFFYK